MKASSIFVTDFDGTLLRNDLSFNDEDLGCLSELRELGCTVVLASGRSPFSLERCLGSRKLPVDWYVLSSGAGVLNRCGKIMQSRTFTPEETGRVHRAFSSLGIQDVSIQGSFPEAHRLHWIPGNHGTDFKTRLELYRGYTEQVASPEMDASEVIGFVEPEAADEVIRALEGILGGEYSIIRATSPIDHFTVWIEVFPQGVNKGTACEFIRKQSGIHRNMTAAVGNDWNDIHMLEWAASPFIVENCPEELSSRYTAVPSNDCGGVASAARKWMEKIR
jgi:HAD superfamily hydrolase (TIGR01484 family)